MLIERYGIEHFMEASTFGALTDAAIRYLPEKGTVLERAAIALAAEDSIVLEVSSALFHKFHDNPPAEFGLLLLNLSREMARRIHKTDELHTAEHK